MLTIVPPPLRVSVSFSEALVCCCMAGTVEEVLLGWVSLSSSCSHLAHQQVPVGLCSAAPPRVPGHRFCPISLQWKVRIDIEYLALDLDAVVSRGLSFSCVPCSMPKCRNVEMPKCRNAAWHGHPRHGRLGRRAGLLGHFRRCSLAERHLWCRCRESAFESSWYTAELVRCYRTWRAPKNLIEVFKAQFCGALEASSMYFACILRPRGPQNCALNTSIRFFGGLAVQSKPYKASRTRQACFTR